ncbi:MAG: phenylacetate--CoA ligase family protein, partial [Desulfomonilaceae bacterium]
MPSFSNISELKTHQLKGLKWTVQHAYSHSEHYKEAMEKAGVKPDDIQSLDDIQKLPFTTVDDLKSGYPFPLLSVPMSDVCRIHASSGTTGKRKILAYTQKDLNDWANFFARCYEMVGLSVSDRVQIAVGYGIWTAG